MHAEADGLLADDAADIAGADDAERLAGDFDAHELRLFPLAGLRRAVCLRQLAGNGEHQSDGVFGRGDRVAERRVHDDDTALGSGRDIDIVDADAGAADDLEVGRGGDQLFRCLGGGADSEAVVVADDFGKLVLVLAELRLEIDFDAAITEDLDGSFGQFVGYENARCHWGLPSKGSTMECNRDCEAPPVRRSRMRSTQAAAWESVAFCVSNAQESHGISFCMSAVSIVAPAQMRRPDGASR